MGLLAVGSPLSWEQSQQYLQHVKKHGIAQFIATYRRLKDRSNDAFLWGDEIEYLLVRLDRSTKSARLLLVAHDLLLKLSHLDDHFKSKVVFHPEYGQFMVETTPGTPYGGFTTHLPLVESNMLLRRHLIHKALPTVNDRLMSMASFPLLGVGTHTDPPLPAGGPITTSSYVPDAVMNPHPRFPCLTENIRKRRTDKVCITVPLFKDKNTPDAASVPAPTKNKWGELQGDSHDTIHMDAMAFGMGCCCLQVTFQCRNIDEARHLYDQLAILSPIMLALTAASPFFKGRIADTDVRWNVISQSVDDRTPYERGLTDDNGGTGQLRLKKSRYSSIDAFIGTSDAMLDAYNDVDLAMHDEHLQLLLAEGIDERLARHVAHLFVRDPLVVFSETIDIDDETETDHFESIQSTNWNTVRFKPPPAHSTTGWRVEFRSMEVQITDFENAAFTVFVALLSRAILFLELNLYLPISLCDVNLERAHARDAVMTQKFYIRTLPKSDCAPCQSPMDQDMFQELTIKEIMCGKEEQSCKFPGMIAFVVAYLDVIKCDERSRALIDEYIDFIQMRASGNLMTAASWMRRFVDRHPDYQHDSNLPQSTVYDLIECCDALAESRLHCPQFLPPLGESHRAILELSNAAAQSPFANGVPLIIDLDKESSDARSVCQIIQLASKARRLVDLRPEPFAKDGHC
ncbi:unnamed protein product (mitochondrion) [Plasmodiophora brassicae]|uniref:Glutamate--cysteine ligase n=1 Tax=Plasmodiophora brassicae TaxID=37360 RepID=A0A0G4IIF9_PLABS|nr:hypothetical protein PBRA_003834 [Plasmodiophora brassicae]SPQ94349.1 unnamed protein product [Plasmodiophora brassicae]